MDPVPSLACYVSVPLAIGFAYAAYTNNYNSAKRRAIESAQNSDYGDDPEDQTALPPNWDPVYLLTQLRAASVRLADELNKDMDSRVELKLRTLEIGYNNFQPSNQFLGTDF